jgi:hypothetical protein
MVQIKLFVAFILAAATIAPVVALPKPPKGTNQPKPAKGKAIAKGAQKTEIRAKQIVKAHEEDAKAQEEHVK